MVNSLTFCPLVCVKNSPTALHLETFVPHPFSTHFFPLPLRLLCMVGALRHNVSPLNWNTSHQWFELKVNSRRYSLFVVCMVCTHAAVDALSFLELSYKVDWPSNIVITSSSIDKYNKIFQLLLQIKRASWALKTAFHHLRQSQSLGEQSARQLQTCRHEFQHFVNIVHGYVANQLFFITWREFDIELTNKVMLRRQWVCTWLLPHLLNCRFTAWMISCSHTPNFLIMQYSGMYILSLTFSL